MKRRAMTSDAASLKKIAGHIHEDDFAALIGGAVNRGAQTNKKDVVDPKHAMHSVKGGEWWQVFLYGRARFETNTMFMGLGDLAGLMVQAIDAFPVQRADYLADKRVSKERLQPPMRKMCAELNKPNMLAAFLSKALFNGGEVDYLSILPKRYANAPLADKVFHVFAQQDVVRILADNLTVINSLARNKNQTDAQKVIFRLAKNVGEIEIRTDSARHYRQAKCRVNGPAILALLQGKLAVPASRAGGQVLLYGGAVNTMRWLA